MGEYYVHIMASRARALYTGMTNDIERRVGEHKSGQCAGYSQKCRTTRLVYVEVHSSPEAAIEREKFIKTWSRARREALIEGSNPAWDDLAADR